MTVSEIRPRYQETQAISWLARRQRWERRLAQLERTVASKPAAQRAC